MTSETHTSAAAERSLVIVHGRDFKPEGKALLDLCNSALSAGIERDAPELLDEYKGLRKELAYYGDLTNELLKAEGGSYDEQLDIGDRRNALNLLKQLDKRKRFGHRQYDNLPGKSAIPEFAADVAAPLLRALGRGKPLIAKVSRDMAAYWDDASDFGARVRERVRQTLCAALDRADRIMLLSHGTGCVVAYDILWELSHDADLSARYSDHKIDVWLTLGAPLGDNAVRRKLFGAKEKGTRRYPNNVLLWHNVAAEDDYTCHDSTVADDFKPMLKAKQVSSIRDYPIYNLAVRYGQSNPHSSVGYYIHPRVSQLMSEWLTQSAETRA